MSKRDTRIAFERMARAASATGLDVAGWTLEGGDRANGISYGVRTPSGASDLVGLPPFGHIGRTASEAERFLDGMTAAFESVAYAGRRQTPLPAERPYTDPSTGEWVGEYATRDARGETHWRTEWFATEAEARHFARTGELS